MQEIELPPTNPIDLTPESPPANNPIVRDETKIEEIDSEAEVLRRLGLTAQQHANIIRHILDARLSDPHYDAGRLAADDKAHAMNP